MILTFNPHRNFWNIQTFHESGWCEKKFFFLACFSFLEQKTMTKNYLGKKRVSWLAHLRPIHHRGKSWQELKPSPRQELGRMLLTGGASLALLISIIMEPGIAPSMWHCHSGLTPYSRHHSRQCPVDMPRDQSNRGESCSWGHCSQGSLVMSTSQKLPCTVLLKKLILNTTVSFYKFRLLGVVEMT